MRAPLSVFIAALGTPLICGGLFVVVFITLVGLAIPQLPPWAQGGVKAWMLGTPQAASDYHGDPGEDPGGVFSGGQVGFAGDVGPVSFVCRMPVEKGVKTDDYGAPRDPYPRHSGIDYGTCHQYDVPVITPMGGKVVFTGWSSAGNSSGPHVHFETRECPAGHCVPRDPNLVLLPGQAAPCAWSELASTC
jgi:murein DD-endopeptidase MepM/ murein hydrolase activator NlpD